MRLREIRIINKYNQKEISSKMNINYRTYSGWERGTDLIPIRRLNDFCNICNVSIDYCLGFTNIPRYNNSTKDLNYIKSGERLKEIRALNNYTQEDIANILDINRSLLSKYEKGHTTISTTFLIEYIKLFNISGDYLLGKIDTKIILKELVKN